MDFSKALDSVDHSILVQKLKRYGLAGHMHGLFTVTSMEDLRRSFWTVLPHSEPKLQFSQWAQVTVFTHVTWVKTKNCGHKTNEAQNGKSQLIIPKQISQNVNKVNEYIKFTSRNVKERNLLKEDSATNGPQGTSVNHFMIVRENNRN